MSDPIAVTTPAAPRVCRCSGPQWQPTTYTCVQSWPADCFVQAGANGIVFGRSGSYRTAFFEAFPRAPDIFLRGEGATIEAAEAACWAWYERVCACPAHDWDRRGRTDGYAFCRGCGVGMMVLAPTTSCHICGVPAAYTQDKDDHWYCEAHGDTLPQELWGKTRRLIAAMDAEDVEDAESQNTDVVG